MTVVEEMDESIQDDEFMADTASVEDMDIAPPHSMSSASEHDQGGPNDDHHNNSSFSSLANNNNNHIRSAIHPENDWFFSQVKGSADPQVTDADIISTVEFNDTGELLATGDKGGRIVIFHRSPDVEAKYGEYQVYSTFQSHEPEFDYLKSLEIEEKINKIKWLPQHNSSHYLLSTNDKTIKLWKIQKKNRKTTGYNLKDEDGNPKHFSNNLIVPRYEPTELMIEASPRRVFSNAHTYHINSISLNTDLETFLSADDLRINLWNLSITDQSFNIVDIKPANMEELSEVITAAEFHPKHCNIFAYSSSRGNVKLCDMRQQALCDSYYKLFEQQEDDSERSQNFFSEICSSLSDVRFSHSGRYMLTRDYLTVKVWDLNMESGPVACYQVHPSLRHKLCWLYENDSIFDKFECSWSHDDRHIITGSYQNRFRIFNLDSQAEYTFEASRELYPTAMGRQLLTPLDDIESGRFDTVKKQIHSAWHPQHDVIALAASDNLYLFTGLEREIPDMPVPREHSREHNTTIHEALDTSNISNATVVSMNSTLSEHKPDSSSINSHSSEHRESGAISGVPYGTNNNVLFRGLTTTPNSQDASSTGSGSQHSREDGSGDHHNL